MANDTSGPVWIIDTAAAGNITTDMLAIGKLRWVGGTTAGHTCVVKNAAGKVVWESLATAANFLDESFFDSHPGGDCNVLGLAVTALGSGKLYIYLQ